MNLLLLHNISCESIDPWRPLGRVLMLYILPTICLSGLALNVACLIVFTQRRSHPLVPALILLSICDSLQLLFSLFVLYLPAVHDHMEMDQQGWIAQIAYISTGTLAGGLLASNCASIWTMCYISIQRHQAIVKPFATVSASKRYCGNISLLGIGIMAIMRKVIYPIAVYLMPLIVITVLNMRILSFINISNRVQSVSGKRRMAKERRSIKLLGSIVLLFFVCHTGIYSNIVKLQILGGLIIRLVDFGQFGNAPCFVFATDLVNFMFNINSFANPMLYFFFTKQFKDLRTSWTSATSSNSTFRKSGEKMRRLMQKVSLKTEKGDTSAILTTKRYCNSNKL